MADGVRIGRSDFFTFSALALGLLAASFYLSVVISFAFLVPVQLAFGRLGKRGGLFAAGLAALVLAIVEAWRLVAGGSEPFLLETLAAMAYPLVLIAALVLLNAAFWGRTAPFVRALVASAGLALLASPLVALVVTDAAVKVALTEGVRSLMRSLAGAAKGASPLSGEGYDSAALFASLDPREMVESTLTMFASCYSALLFLLLGGSWWLGNRLAGEGSEGRRETPALSELHLPANLIWPFLASWALVFAALFIKAGPAPLAFAWNLSLLFSLAYAAQGTGIVAHYLARWKVPRSFRIALAVSAFIALLSPPIGTFIVAILPLLGVTELWIPYRNPKGVGA